MSPWVLAFIVIAPLSFLAGFLIRPFIAPGASSPPQGSSLTLKDIAMAVFAELQPSLDALNAAADALPGKVAAAVAAGDPQTAQDKADTIAAVEAASQKATDAINAVGGA